MRIFLSGNEEAARWHLPIAQAKVNEFVARTEKAGLNQNTFSFIFEDSGARVFAQYAFGQASMQIHAPFIPMVEEEIKETEETFGGPKTFYVNTSQGYFWVEVRYIDGVPSVILTQFAATITAKDGIATEFVYPGFALNAPGMLSGCIDGDPAMRYVLSQNGGVMTGEGEEKGSISLPKNINQAARLTPVDGDSFVLIYSNKGQEVSVRKVNISGAGGAVEVELLYDEIISTLEAIDGNLSPANLCPNPTWLHRKCAGSYFSPNKTIGYHVDIGTDDDFVGNPLAIPGLYGNKLDNPEGEAYFNHTKDLYRFAGMVQTPLEVSASSATFVILAPTMYFQDTSEGLERCWGGNGISQTEAGCLDYAGDSLTWMLSPRLIKATVDLVTKERSFVDFSLSGNADEEIEVASWDGTFSGKFFYSSRYDCDNVFFEEEGTKEVGSECTWSDSCSGNCGNYSDPVGFTGECPGRWRPFQHWAKYFREDLRHSKHLSLCFGNNVPRLDKPGEDGGFYFLFDGLWHLDGGVLWSTAGSTGNRCALCSIPSAGQSPGGMIYFSLNGGDSDEWILASGHEYVENLNVIAPLGYNNMPDAAGTWGVRLGFIAQVPEDIDEDHESKVLVGGVAYPASNVPGELVKCERRFMNDPCLCEDEMTWDGEHDTLILGATEQLAFTGGCPPFNWVSSGVVFKNSIGMVLTPAQLELTRTVFADAISAGCNASVTVADSCGDSLSVSDAVGGTGAATGPLKLEPNETGYFTHDLTYQVEYTGSLDFVSGSGGGITLRMPSDATPGYSYTASWMDGCGKIASVSVLCNAFKNGECVAPSSGSLPFPAVMRVWRGWEQCFTTVLPPPSGYTWGSREPNTWATTWDASGFIFVWWAGPDGVQLRSQGAGAIYS